MPRKMLHQLREDIPSSGNAEIEKCSYFLYAYTYAFLVRFQVLVTKTIFSGKPKSTFFLPGKRLLLPFYESYD